MGSDQYPENTVEERRSVSPIEKSAHQNRSPTPSPTRVSSEHDGEPAASPSANMMPQDPKRAPTPPPYAPMEYAATGFDSEPPHKSSWRDSHPSLPRYALPAALLVGFAITGGTTYALVAWVLNSIANASVDSDMNRWKADAKSKVYDACYLGCNSCDDPSFAFDACQRTAKVSVKGLICDGNRMWNWRVEDRTPDACLEEVGKILQGDALKALKKSYRNRLAIIILTVLAGVIGGVITYLLWRKYSRSKGARQAAKEGRPLRERTRTWRPSTWRQEKPRQSNHHPAVFTHDTNISQSRTSSRSSSHRARSRSRTRSSSTTSRSGHTSGRGSGNTLRFLTAFMALFGNVKPARAYACTGREAAWNQFFTTPPNTNGSAISGIIHGWFSNCYDRQDCHRSCHNSCSTDSNGNRHCSEKCTNKCVKRTYTDRVPRDFVDDVIPRVRACGFDIVDGVSGSSPGMRVGNARIEKDLWVRISVSGFNVTREDETDEKVFCLHDIGGQ